MQQHLSAKRRERTRVVSRKSEGNPEDAMQQRQTWEWIRRKEVPGLPAFTVCLFRILCGPIPNQSMDCSVGFKRMFINKFEVYKPVARARVNKSGMEGISRDVMVMEGIREFGSERADVLSLNSCGAQSQSMQPPVCAELWELLIIFLTLQQQESQP